MAGLLSQKKHQNREISAVPMVSWAKSRPLKHRSYGRLTAGKTAQIVSDPQRLSDGQTTVARLFAARLLSPKNQWNRAKRAVLAHKVD
eukprot:COSAG02_NODE_6871_length_3314_cov_356.221151_2_plen_88_part_00